MTESSSCRRPNDTLKPLWQTERRVNGVAEPVVAFAVQNTTQLMVDYAMIDEAMSVGVELLSAQISPFEDGRYGTA